MSLFADPVKHAANPPETWTVVKAAERVWDLRTSDDDATTLDRFTTKRQAEAAKVAGWLVNLYVQEARWYTGGNVPLWKRYVPPATLCSAHGRPRPQCEADMGPGSCGRFLTEWRHKLTTGEWPDETAERLGRPADRRTSREDTTMAEYIVGSETVTFSAQAPAEVAGTTATRWYVADSTGRRMVSGLRTEAAAYDEAELLACGDQLVAVALGDGTAASVRLDDIDRFRGLDEFGNHVYAMDAGPGCDYLYATTPCCNASGKGSACASGVVCRSCYAEVDAYFGGPAEVAIPLVDR